MHITVYTRLNCNKCEELIEEKIRSSFSYTQETINANYQSKRDFVKHGFKYVPAIVIRSEDGEILVKEDNVSFNKFDSLIDKVGGYA